MFRLVLLALSIVCTAPDLLGKAHRSPLAGWHINISPDSEGWTGRSLGAAPPIRISHSRAWGALPGTA